MAILAIVAPTCKAVENLLVVINVAALFCRSDKNVSSFITKRLSAELIEDLQSMQRKESQATPMQTPSAGPSPATSGALPASVPSAARANSNQPQAAPPAVEDPSVSKQELRWAYVTLWHTHPLPLNCLVCVLCSHVHVQMRFWVHPLPSSKQTGMYGTSCCGHDSRPYEEVVQIQQNVH